MMLWLWLKLLDKLVPDFVFYSIQFSCFSISQSNVKIQKNWTHKKFAVIILKFEKHGFTMEKGVQKMQMEWQTV